MRIAVTTPTGTVGRAVVAALLRVGVRPRVLLRDPARLPDDVRDAVEPVVVDSHDAEGVTRALDGVDSVYWVDPTTGSADPEADYRRATASIARAVSSGAVGRVVLQSSVGAERRSGAGEIDFLAATETALDDLGADVVHLRCGYFCSNLLLQVDDVRAGLLQVLLPLDQPLPWVAPRDVAEVGAAHLLSSDWSGRHVRAVHGPAHLTWPEAAEAVSAAVGRPLHVEQVADDVVRAQLRAAGMGEALVEAVVGMSTGLRGDVVPEQPRTVRTTTPTTLGAWSYEHLRPLL